MAKPYKNATPICIGLSILAALGIILALIAKSPILIVLFLIPTIAYEVYRTEGESTKLASWGMLVVFLIEAVLILFNVSFNLATFFGEDQKSVAGYLVPLGDIKVVGPTLMVILAIVLFIRTRGVYTRWLAVIIFISAFALIYTIAPGVFSELLKFGLNEALDNVNF